MILVQTLRIFCYLGTAVVFLSGKPTAAIVSDGFDFPVCAPIATPEPDGDGCYVFQHFGENNHLGEDWNGELGGNSDFGDPVFAISNGTIISAQDEGLTWGNVIVIEHELLDGTSVRSLYGHLDQMLFTSGDVVRGEQIGTIGRGRLLGIDGEGEPIYYYDAHLHFEIREDTSLGIDFGYRTDNRGWCNPTTFIRDGVCTPLTIAESFTPSVSGSGRGVAFDPDTGRLYYTIRQSNNIFITDANNTPATSVSPGVRFGALSWDAKRGVLWGGGYQFSERGNVYQITPAGVKTFQFTFIPHGGNCYSDSPGFIDGLAYDEGPTLANSDDSLWMSDDAGVKLHHVDLSGNLIATFAVPNNPRSGNPGCNTGIAVDGDFLWLALQSGPDLAPHDIVKVAKSDPTTVLSSFAFSNTNIPGPEDLELDLVTVPGTAALWSNQFGTPNFLKLWKLRSTGII